MSEPETADFDEIDRLLAAGGAAWEAAEAHGSFCGMACLGGVGAILKWLAEVFPETDSNNVLAQERTQVFKQLAANTIISLEAGNMGFELLLPDDDEPLQQRATSLADWCHGFMHGLAAAGGADQGPQADALDASLPAEILDDFSQITKAGAEPGEGDESEQAFAELVEYVRVSAQLIYEETAALRPAATAGQD